MRKLSPGAVRTPGATLLLLALLGACGGSSPTEPLVSPSPASVEAASYGLLNSARHDAGVDDLVLDPQITEVARDYSRKMRDEGFFDHIDPAGNMVDTRLRVAGVRFTVVGENLANVSHSSDPARVAHQLLMGNAVHRSNILDPRFSEVGVGVAQSGDVYWITQIFVRP